MDFYQYLPAPPRASCWLDVVETLHSKIQMWWGYNPHIREVLAGTVLTVAEIHKYHVILPQTGKFDLRSKDQTGGLHSTSCANANTKAYKLPAAHT